MLLLLAWRNLFQKKVRFAASAGGVALALSLMLMLDAVFQGVEGQLTAYMDNSGADLFVSQQGVKAMHMAASWLPATLGDQIKKVEGVSAATPLLYLSTTLKSKDKSYAVYLFGIAPDAEMGKPWQVAEGKTVPASGETVLDRNLAANLKLKMGDNLKVLGREFKVAGLSEGTGGLISSMVFIARDDFTQLRNNLPVVSYFLVKVVPGADPQVVAARLQASLSGTTVQTKDEFAAQERKLVKDMGADVLNIVNLIGFGIGLAVVALTTYIAIFTRRAEYGLLKALGARNSHLYRQVLSQVLVSVAIGFGVSLALTILLSFIVPLVSTNLVLAIGWAAVIKVILVSLIIAGIAAVLPVWQLGRLDPALVFKKGGL
ncbi:MAG: FtsX-like permease family protein [Chloroflexi bacterium]|nr:FtsX-like permease family protein [Chloroflexota bacterium]OJV91779.1 MAG: hypothetical protein BGO39_17980 [Chloroflexi bacterium 54-19]